MTTPAFDSHADQFETQCMRGLSVTGESKEFFARGRLEYLAGFVRGAGFPPPRRVVDYGCGVGDVTVLLAETFDGSSVLGLDPSPRCIESALRHRGSSQVSFETLEDARRVEAEPVDLLHVNGVLHHVQPADRPALCADLWRRIRPGGLLGLFENNPINPGTRLVMSRIPFDRDAQVITAWRTRALLRAAGFEILETRYLFYFPRVLRALRPMERFLTRVPLGAQYGVVARRSGG